MFNALIKIYDWYHEEIEPTCPPESDSNILCPIYYGKVNVSNKANAVEISMTRSGTVGTVRKFSVDSRSDDYGEKMALTPSCVQHRRHGASRGDREYAFFNKFSVIFGLEQQSWLNMYDSWVAFHEQHDLEGDISPIKNILDFVRSADSDAFLETWNSDGIIDDAGKTIIVFTLNGRKIFDGNPALYKSYALFYEQWCRKIYNITEAPSALSGAVDLNIEMPDGTPVAFGIAYSNGRKIITKPKSNSTTLDTLHIFNVQKGFNSYFCGLRDMWKFYTTFDYICEQQREWDLETRNLFFFVPERTFSCSYEDSLRYREMLGALKQYQQGYKSEVPDSLRKLNVGYILRGRIIQLYC